MAFQSDNENKSVKLAAFLQRVASFTAPPSHPVIAKAQAGNYTQVGQDTNAIAQNMNYRDADAG